MFRNIKCFFKNIVFPVLVTIIITLAINIVTLAITYNFGVGHVLHGLVSNDKILYPLFGVIGGALLVVCAVAIGLVFVALIKVNQQQINVENQKRNNIKTINVLKTIVLNYKNGVYQLRI